MGSENGELRSSLERWPSPPGRSAFMHRGRLTRVLALLLVSSTAAHGGQTPREAFDRVNPSVVTVHTEQRSNEVAQGPAGTLVNGGLGSGVLVDASGLVLTAAHVVQAADRITVEFVGGQRVSATVVAAAPFADLALLRLESVPPGVGPATLGDSSSARVGDQVFVIGAPYGFAHTLTSGWLSARRQLPNIAENLTALEALQLDVSIYQGNSGGPVFNLNGEVIGLVSHVILPSNGPTISGPAFAVASNVARQLMLDEPGTWLGVETALVAGPFALALNLPQSAGLLVQSVADRSLGERLGLREGSLPVSIEDQSLLLGGDVILSMLGVPVSSEPAVLSEIQRRLNRLRALDVVEVVVFRAGRTTTLTAIMRER